MADQPRSEEMKANLGLKSTFKTGSTGVPKAAQTDPAQAYSPEHKLSLAEHLKALLGVDHTPAMGETNSANATSVQEALGKGIADGTKAGPE